MLRTTGGYLDRSSGGYLSVFSNPHYQNLLLSYEQSIRAKGYARPKYFGSAVTEFFFFLETKGIEHIKDVKAKHVIAHFEYLSVRPHEKKGGLLSERSVRTYMMFLRILFDHLIDTKVLQASPIHLPRFSVAGYRQRSVATDEEVKLIYKAAETRLDRAILALAYGCGLRKLEIEKMQVGDLWLSQGTLIVRCGKFGKSRRVPLSDTVVKDLREYIVNERSQLHGVTNPALLLDTRGNKLHGYWLNERLKRMITKTKNRQLIAKNITLHCLRHSIATHLLDNGASMDFVRRFLGHVFLDTTHIYSKRRKQRRLLMDRIHPVGT